MTGLKRSKGLALVTLQWPKCSEKGMAASSDWRNTGWRYTVVAAQHMFRFRVFEQTDQNSSAARQRHRQWT